MKIVVRKRRTPWLLLVALLATVTSGVWRPVSAFATNAAQDVAQLNSATTEDGVEHALETIFAHAGIATHGGSVQPSSAPTFAVPLWTVELLAGGYLRGRALDMPTLASRLDAISRRVGGSAITASGLAQSFTVWSSSAHLSATERYTADVLEALGRATVPPFDLASGNATKAQLPEFVLGLLGNLMGTPGPKGADLRVSAPDAIMAASNPCDAFAVSPVIDVNSANVATPSGWWSARGARANGGDEAPPDDFIPVSELPPSEAASDMAQIARDDMVDATVDVMPASIQRPKSGTTLVTYLVKATWSDDVPKDISDCLKSLGVDPNSVGRGKPLGLGTATITAGALFAKHLTISGGDSTLITPSEPAQLLAEARLDPKGSKELTDTAIASITVDVPLAGGSLITVSRDAPVTVHYHADKGHQISGVFSADVPLIARVSGTFNAYTCDEELHAWTGTVHLDGNLEGLEAAAAQLFGKPLSGNKDVETSFNLPSVVSTDANGQKVYKLGPGAIVPLGGGKMSLQIATETSALILFGGYPLTVIPAGVDSLVITDGAPECGDSQ